MKKVARMRFSPNSLSEEMGHNRHTSQSEPLVRTTGRIKKPKAVFDPSDNYLSRAQRSLIAGSNLSSYQPNLERRASYTKSSTISPIGPTESKDACVICNKKESKRPQFAIKNPLITCQGCQRKIHKLCLKVEFEDFESIQRDYKCDKCSTCRICKDMFINGDEEMITCSKCAECFHIVCFPSKLIKSDNFRNWKCNKCYAYNQITNGTTLPVKKIREIIGSGEPSTIIQTEMLASSEKSQISAVEKVFVDNLQVDTNTRTTSPLLTKPSSLEKHSNDTLKNEETEDNEMSPPPEKLKKVSNQSPDTLSADIISINSPSKSGSTGACLTPNENFDDIPDVKEWSVEQVYKYFHKYFPKEADVFKNEEIDGPSLLLLKRSDIVKKLPIKLGPSLRIYSLILKIQAQLNDHTLGWNCGL